MEINIDLETCKIIVCIKQWYRYAVFIDKISGKAIELTIPELIHSLELAAKEHE